MCHSVYIIYYRELTFLCILGGVYTVLPNGSLQISKSSVLDSGTYICVAQNPAGTALGKTKIRVQGRPNCVTHETAIIVCHRLFCQNVTL